MTLCECGCGLLAPISTRSRADRGQIKGQPVRFIKGHAIHVNAVPSLKQGYKSRDSLLRAEYEAFLAARNRCTNPEHPAYKHYGGRGIKFLFTSFEQFFKELGPRPSNKHSVDRENNDGNYESGNVHWATKSEQNSNRRHLVREM